MNNGINTEINSEEINGIKIESSLSPVEVKVDLTGVVNKAYDEGLSPVVKKTGNGLAFCFDFLASIVKPYMYEKIQEAQYKCKEIDKKLEEKYNNTPEENRIFPRTSILGPSLDVLKYNLDEEHIKEAFINLLSHEMDDRSQKRVVPSYIDIIRNLSSEDALFLKKIYAISKEFVPIMKLKLNVEKGYKDVGNYMLVVKDNCEEINPLVIGNLIKQNLVEIDTFNTIVDANENYEKAFKTIKNNLHIPYGELDYFKYTLKFTGFGKNFIDICLS